MQYICTLVFNLRHFYYCSNIKVPLSRICGFTFFEILLDIITAHYITVLSTTYNPATEERSYILSVLNLLEICCRPVTIALCLWSKAYQKPFSNVMVI